MRRATTGAAKIFLIDEEEKEIKKRLNLRPCLRGGLSAPGEGSKVDGSGLGVRAIANYSDKESARPDQRRHPKLQKA